MFALWWSLSGTLCGTFDLEWFPYFWFASACQDTTYSCCYSVALDSCIYFYTVSAMDTLCAGGPFILLCLKGNSDDILGWYFYTWAIILQKYILYFPWMSLRSFFIRVTHKKDVLLLWLHNRTSFIFSLLNIFMDTYCSVLVRQSHQCEASRA